MIFAIRYWKQIAAGLAVLAVLLTVFLHFRSDERTRDKLATLQDEAQTVVLAVREASGNQDADWSTAPGQIRALGESNKALKSTLAIQTESIDQMAREAVRLRKHASEMQAFAAKARAQRASALARLSDMAVTPGTRADCLQLLAEAEAALDLTREALQ